MTKDKRILIKNIYHMLAYAFTSLNEGDFEDIATEEFDNLHNLFAAILSKGISRLLKQGLYREYAERQEDIVALRGRIDMPGTIRHYMERERMLCCRYDELSENNLLNQILKTTAMLLLRHGIVDAEYKAVLKQELMFFSEVELVKPDSVQWERISLRRNNSAYRMLLGVCRLVLEGMLLTTEQGTYWLASFVDERGMSRLYEKFILEYYIREHPELKASASQIPWVLDDGYDAMLPVMQTDITLSRGNQVLIIDAKWYAHTTQARYDVRTLHSHNLYQIFAYVKNREAGFGSEAHRVSGMLLYARTDEAVQPDEVYQMSGNQISVKTLDLNQEFREIARALDAIAESCFAADVI